MCVCAGVCVQVCVSVYSRSVDFANVRLLLRYRHASFLSPN